MRTTVTQPLGLVQAAPAGDVPSVEVSAAIDPLIGVTIGEFRVDGYLAQGGMGRVYTATHRRLPNLRRAVKVLADTTREADHAAFMKEAQAASEVKSINIVGLHDFGFLPEGAPYLMMELLEGQTLEAHLRDLGTIPYMEALALAQQVLAGLSAIHSAGLVHRDIKPANLFLVNDASQGVVVKVMDLGLVAARPKGHQDTGVGTEKELNRAGTPVYASPEQFGDLVVGPASDVYSLGVVLYELVTGEAPFAERPGESESALPRRHQKERPRHPGLFVPDLPESIASFMLSLLEKEPLKRPTVAAAQNQVKRLRERFRDRLREGPTQIKANPLEPPARNTDQLPPRLSTEEALAGVRGDRRPMVVVAIVGALLLLGLGIAVRMQPDERAALEPAPLVAPPPVEVAAAKPADEPKAIEAADLRPMVAPEPTKAPSGDELTALPPEPAAKPRLAAVTKRAAPTTKAVVTRLEACTFDPAFRSSARQQREALHQVINSSHPLAQQAEMELEEGLATQNCHQVNAAMAKLERIAGVMP